MERDDPRPAPLSDAEFDELGRSAGEALRLPAPSGGVAAIGRRARRRAATRAVVSAGCVAGLAAGTFVVLHRAGNDGPDVANTPSTTATIAPTTTAPPTTPTTVPPPESVAVTVPPEPAPAVIDRTTAAAIATGALLGPDQIGSDWTAADRYDAVSPLSSNSAAPACAAYLGTVLDPPGVAVAWTGFAPSGATDTTTFQHVAVYPTVDEASAAMDAIADAEFVPCLQERFATIATWIGEPHEVGGIGAFGVGTTGDREILFNAVYDDGEPLNQLHSFVQVERAILYVNPTRRLGADLERVLRPAVTELRHALATIDPAQAAIATAAERARAALVDPGDVGDVGDVGEGWVDAYEAGRMDIFDGAIASWFSLAQDPPAAGTETPPDFDESCIAWGDAATNPFLRSIAVDDRLLASADVSEWAATVVWAFASGDDANAAIAFLADGGDDCFLGRTRVLFSDGAADSWSGRDDVRTVERTEGSLTLEQSKATSTLRMTHRWQVSGASVVYVGVQTADSGATAARLVIDAATRAADREFSGGSTSATDASDVTFTVGPRRDLPAGGYRLEGDGTLVAERCTDGDEVRCEIERLDAATFQPVDRLTCPVSFVGGEPQFDLSAAADFLRRHPRGDTPTGTTGNWGTTLCSTVDLTDGIALASSIDAGLVVAFDTRTGEELWRRDATGGSLSPDGKFAIIRQLEQSTPKLVVAARTGSILRVLSSDSMTFDPTGRYHFFPLQITDLTTGAVALAREARGAFFDVQGEQLVVLLGERLELVDATTWTTRWSVPSATLWEEWRDAELGIGDFSPDGSVLAIGLEPRLVDVRTGELLGTVPDACGSGDVTTYRWLPDGETLVVGCAAGSGPTAWLVTVTVGGL